MNFSLKTIAIALMMFASTMQAQIPQDLLNKAKAAGISDEQIQQELAKHSNLNNSNNTNTIPQSINVVQSRTDNEKVIGEVAKQKNSVRNESSISAKELSGMIYGSEIFSDANLSFSPNINIPTPQDYQLATGDEVFISVWGASEINLNQTISPEGVILIPNVGPISLSGLTVQEAGVRIKQELGRIMSGLLNEEDPNTFVNVSLGKIRSITVNIVGEAKVPGTYTLPSLATLFNALYVAGGVNEMGTLRKIKVYRNSKVIAQLDVYDYLLKGKFETNIRLENDDMILIEPYENHVSINGKVKRNRIFEVKKDETIQDLINLAGGFRGDAFSEKVQVIRKSGDRFSIATVEEQDFASFKLNDNDVVKVDAIIPVFENRLTIKGAVWRPNEYELTSQTNSVKKLVEAAAGLKGDEFLGRAHLTRLNKDFTKKIIAIDIKGILNETAPDVELFPEDELYILSLDELKEKYTVSVHGAVNIPNTVLEYKNNMTVEDAIILAGGLREAAATVNVEVARRIKNPKAENSTPMTAEIYTFTLSDNLEIVQGDVLFELEPFDKVFVRFSPGYQEQQVIKVNGEVLFSGSYVISKKNERLSDLITKAGGITTQAYIEGASLKRKLSESDLRRLETSLQISNNKASQDSINSNMLDLGDYTVGIDLQRAIVRPGSSDDIILQDGDVLSIPQYQSTVKISGAVTYPNSVTYNKGMSVRDCLAQAGGYSDVARKYPIVVYMNGKVATTKKTWIFFKRYPKVTPGCEILVPMRRLNDRKPSLIEVLSLANSTTSMAAMVTSIINSMK